MALLFFRDKLKSGKENRAGVELRVEQSKSYFPKTLRAGQRSKLKLKVKRKEREIEEGNGGVEQIGIQILMKGANYKSICSISLVKNAYNHIPYSDS